ncbi:hypothetical protein F511_21569 [Dorcoceras hygrometricum]|uniref:Uncharacterized protein n=1 Tax=Dorcoceras hygrometricum TaxID=472368 RepID=A0A2Z7AA84_9LAMI|nr:hypothetical protein F511_21569 [Dorcoceras hygrometricum]
MFLEFSEQQEKKSTNGLPTSTWYWDIGQIFFISKSRNLHFMVDRGRGCSLCETSDSRFIWM